MGYSRAGFTEIVGVDNRPQKNYPFAFVQGDALEYLAAHGHEFDAIHASPPCQGYSIMNNLPWLRDRTYPLLILPTLEMLEALGKPYVVENVMGARHGAKGLSKRNLEAHGLKAGFLCGASFGMPLYRHRLFATSFFWLAPSHHKHRVRVQPGRILGGRARGIIFEPSRSLAARQQGNGAQAEGVGVGHAKGWRKAATAMGIDWMDRDGVSQAIPPAYCEFIGRHLLAALKVPALTRLVHWPEMDSHLRAGYSPWHLKAGSRHTVCGIEYPRNATTFDGPRSALECAPCREAKGEKSAQGSFLE